jgi:hypothetical protein
MKTVLCILFVVSVIGALNPMGCVYLAKKVGLLVIKCPPGHVAVDNDRCVKGAPR